MSTITKWVVYIDALCGPGFTLVSEGDEEPRVELWDTEDQVRTAMIAAVRDYFEGALDKWEHGDIADLQEAADDALGLADETRIDRVEYDPATETFLLWSTRFNMKGERVS